MVDKITNETLSTNWFYPNNNYGGFKSIQLEKAILSASDFIQLDDYNIFELI